MWSRTQSRSTWVVSGWTGALRSSTPNRWQALSKAGWAVSGLMMLGRVMPRVWAACSRPATGPQPARVIPAGCRRLAVVQVEDHRDDLRLELGGTRADVTLEHVHMGEQTEGLIHEGVVLVIA